MNTELINDDVPKVTGSPDYIYLVYGDIEQDCTHDECHKGGEVCWCPESVYSSDVKYIRADKAEAEIERLESELQKAREYVPYDRNEWVDLIEQYSSNEHNMSWRKYIEAAIIQRAGLVVKGKERCLTP